MYILNIFYHIKKIIIKIQNYQALKMLKIQMNKYINAK